MYDGKPEKLKEIKKVRNDTALPFLEGGEFVKIYFHTDKLICSACTILPGQTGEFDKGHRGAEEVCYCVRGNVVIHFPNSNKYVEVREDDAVIIPEGVPHQIFNVGDTKAKMIFFAAPGLGRD